MELCDLKNDIVVCHVKHSRLYTIISCNTKMKDSELGWIDSVIYKPLYENPLEMFTRERQSFLNEFEKV